MNNESGARKVAERVVEQGRASDEISLAAWLIAALDELQALRGPNLGACRWLDAAGDECGKSATRGTTTTGPLCDKHGEQHQDESEGR